MIGLVSVYLFLSSFFFTLGEARLTRLQLCIYFVFIGISIDFEMMLRGGGKVHVGTLAVGPLASGELLGVF